jgi:membrane-anchored protein YejM (alkaline phosphatase superfamily)
VRDLEVALERCSPEQPLAAFLFFDSTHARYHFAPESVIRQPYADDIDYSDLDLGSNIELMQNRYLNAVHDVDGRVGEVVALLQKLDLADETLLLVTGDHGQEFMEHGHWGHNSNFSDEQLLVPFVLHVPGRAPQRLERMTSHIDVVPTIMHLLGYSQPVEHYSLGNDLLLSHEREFAVACNWTELCWITDEVKITLPYRGPSLTGADVRTSDDVPCDDPARVLAENSAALGQILRGMARFDSSVARP